MSNDLLTFAQQKTRGMDSNSLLRMYDGAQFILRNSVSHFERLQADKAIQRIVKELQRRKVSF